MHDCWSPDTNSPCCTDEAEAETKVAEANVNMFAMVALDKVALPRLTHVRKMRKRLLISCGNESFGLSAYLFGVTIAPDLQSIPHIVSTEGEYAMRPEDVGSGVSDHQRTHGTRCSRVGKWFLSSTFKVTLAVTEVVGNVAEGLQTDFSGHEGQVVS